MKRILFSAQCIFAIILLIVGLSAKAQVISGNLTGTIYTSDNKPAALVSVGLKEISKATVTAENGSFSIKNLKPGIYTLKISFLGLASQEQQVEIIGGQTVKSSFILAEDLKKLNEVTITGYKTPNLKPVSLGKIAITPKDLPQSVQIISNQVISDQQANRLSDVIKNVNGVALGADRGSVSGENFYARGYSLGTNNVFKNGARANSGGLPETSTLESVEVLKGSAALLYGGITGGAVVNMITKKPKFNFGGEVAMRSGSYDLYKPTGDIYGPISKNLAFRVVGTVEDAASFRDKVGTKRKYINPSLLYNLGKNTELIVQGDYLQSNYTPDFGIGTVGNKIADIGRNTFLNTNWTYNKTNTLTSQASLNHSFNDSWKLNTLISLQAYNRNYFSTERPAAASNGDWKRVLTRSKTKEYSYNQQISLNGKFKTGKIAHMVLIGTDADQSEVNAFNYKNPNKLYDAASKVVYYDQINLLDLSKYEQRSDIPLTADSLHTKTPQYRLGTFFQDLITLTPKFKVLAGIRYTYQHTPRSRINNIEKSTLSLGNNGINKSKAEDAFSPKLGLIYQPVKAASLYVSYANNFTSNTGLDINTNAPMDPSIIDQYEAGVKSDWLKGRLSANLTWYKIENNKFAQTALFKADGTQNSDNNLKEFTGQTASDGIELDLSGTIVKGLNFLAGYSYNYMRYTKTREEVKITTIHPQTNLPTTTTVPGGIIEGERLVGTTKNTANGTLFYTLGSGNLKGLKLGASAYYTGNRNGGRNTNKSGTSTGIIPLNGFTTFDISGGYTYKKISILGKISNISNELNYYVHENYSVNPIPPRQFVTTLSYKF
ncbi:MAG: TonB-dependent receptor [Pyrinomonadaceae bacterium]|nr:TonB-dependent receptor [Sphingobacteriaceae bacterium]